MASHFEVSSVLVQTSNLTATDTLSESNLLTTLMTFEDTTEPPIGLVSQAVFDVLFVFITQFSLPFFELCGIASNTINLIVFSSMGLKDCVNSSFFALSLTDLLYLLASFVGWFSPIFQYLDVHHRIGLTDLSVLSVWYAVMIMAASNHITTYIAIQRCCCVALPLKFKGVFTTKRNVLSIVFIVLGTVALHVPILSKIGMKTYVDLSTNLSWIGISYADDYSSVLAVKDFVAGMWLPVVTQALTVVCMAILLVSLQKSARFRQQATTISSTSASGKVEGSSGTSSDASKVNKSQSKEIQVVKAVTVVTLMFVVCNLAPIIQALIRRAESGFAFGRRYHRMFLIVVGIKHAVQHLNASLNIFVYLAFNTNYRRTLNRVILCAPRKEAVNAKLSETTTAGM